MQLWSSNLAKGSVVDVKEEGDTLLVKFASDYRQPTAEELRAVKIEQMAERLWERECYCCDSSLVSDMIQAAAAGELSSDLQAEWDISDDRNVTNLNTDPFDWDYRKCREWLEERGIRFPDPDPMTMNAAELLELLGEEPE